MNKKYLKWITPLIIISLSVMVTFFLGFSREDEKKKDIKPYIPNIKSLLIESKDFNIYIESEGHLEPKLKHTLSSEVGGKILFLSNYFDNGLIFEKGDTLAIIDSSDYRIARINARFALADAKLEFLRQKALSDRSQAELDEYNMNSDINDLAKNKPQLEKAEFLFEAAKANYEKAESDIKKTIILAPFRGRIVSNQSSPGIVLPTPNSPLATIYSTDEMLVRLPISIEEIDLLGLKKENNKILSESEISVNLKAFIGGKEYEILGNYIGISGSIDKMTQKIDLNISIDNFKKQNLVVDDNLFVNAKVYGKVYQNIFLIPNVAINDRGYVYIIKDKKIFKRKVEILKAYTDSTLVKSGLSDGERINLTRLEYYIDGMEVNPVE